MRLVGSVRVVWVVFLAVYAVWLALLALAFTTDAPARTMEATITAVPQCDLTGVLEELRTLRAELAEERRARQEFRLLPDVTVR